MAKKASSGLGVAVRVDPLIEVGQLGEEPQHRLAGRADLPPDADVLEKGAPQLPPWAGAAWPPSA